MGKRIVAREIVFQLVFGFIFTGEKDDQNLDIFLEDLSLDNDDKNYIQNTYQGVINHFEEIQEILKTNITGYTIDRVEKVALTCLVLGVYEIKYNDLVPAIAVDEMVKLAKKFGDEKSYKFVNGVLAKIVKWLKGVNPFLILI